MYRQKSEKALLEGGGAIAPPAPPLATLMLDIFVREPNLQALLPRFPPENS